MRVYINFYQDDWVDWFLLAEFVANNQVSEITGFSPFFANYGFHPYLSIEPTKSNLPIWFVSQKRKAWNVYIMADRIEWIFNIAKVLLAEIKEKYETQTNKHRSDTPRYKINDQVWLNSANIKTQRPSPKLSDIWLGPYKVLDIQNHSCILELDSGSRLCKIFYNSLL